MISDQLTPRKNEKKRSTRRFHRGTPTKLLRYHPQIPKGQKEFVIDKEKIGENHLIHAPKIVRIAV